VQKECGVGRGSPLMGQVCKEHRLATMGRDSSLVKGAMEDGVRALANRQT
jgi:hypothetical protein